MALANIVPIDIDTKNQPVIIHSTESRTLPRTVWLLHTKNPIESLNGTETYVDANGEEWILPSSRGFPDFINKKYGTPDYMPTTKNFLDKIIESIKTKANDIDMPPFPYQKFVRDYLGYGTPYRSLVLEHGLGSGKTKSSIMVAQTFRRAGLKTLVLTPAFLRDNFIQEIQKWEDDIDINAHYMFAHYNATGNSPGATDKTGADIGGRGGVFDQLGALGIGFDSEDSSYGNIFPYLNKKYNYALKPPAHMLIIIEEAHNLNRSFINAKESRTKALLYPLLMKAVDCKFICLTGTPVISNPFEMAPIYNVMQGPLKDGHNAFPQDEGTFNGYFVDYANEMFINTEIMMKRMVGLGSYFVGIHDDVNREIFPDRRDIIVPLKTMPYQTYHHDIALSSEIEKLPASKKNKLAALPGGATDTALLSDAQQQLTANSSYHTRSRAACNYVFPKNVARPSTGRKEWDKLRAHQFTFKTPDGELKTNEDFQKVYDKILEHVDLEDKAEEETAAWLKIKDNNAKRRVLSKLFMILDATMNNGMPKTHPLYNYLTEDDLMTIDLYVGKYQDRMKLALKKLAAKPENFTLNVLAHHSIKMAAIYKRITGDIENGAPHLIDAPADNGSNQFPVDDQKENDDDGDLELFETDETEDASDADLPAAEMTKMLVEPIHDPLDPILKHEDVFLDKIPKGKIVAGGPAVVYSYFSSAEGAMIFSMVLQAHGFAHFNSSTASPDTLPRAKRYAFFRGGMDHKLKRNIIKVFNSKENVNGQLIRVMFVTQAAAEGISLFNVRQIHIMEPHWDNVMIEQVIGRGFRLTSHKHIKRFEERFITVYRYFCKRPDEETLNAKYPDYYSNFKTLKSNAMMADDLIQRIADRKDKFRLKLNDIRIKVAVDCFLNKDYNNPKDGCFRYYGATTGLAYNADISVDFDKAAETKKIGSEDVFIKFIELATTSKGQKKTYFYYGNVFVNLAFEGKTSMKLKAQKIYGPIDPATVPKKDETFQVPDNAMAAGYITVTDKGKRFISIGSGKEI